VDHRVYPAVVKLLDTVLQSLEQIRSLSITDESPDISSSMDARLSFAKARRCAWFSSPFVESFNSFNSQSHRCYYLCLAHASVKNFAQSLALNSRAVLHLREARSLIQPSQEPIPEELFFPLGLPDIDNLTNTLESDGLRLKKEWFAYNGGAPSSINVLPDGKKYKKPVFFDVAFNYIQSPLEKLEERAGKAKSKPADATYSPVIGTAGKKGKVDVEEELPEEVLEPIVTETSKSSGLSGLLGGWWGRR